ncbi:unnamed protein product [Lymnaea stagnalis]|uniref:Peptidyl-prolyl cis-trans isomerase n=1 Tax=Lymnaea stagnalis TaxID=6523 RepID=A0AAV2I188_LYMST
MVPEYVVRVSTLVVTLLALTAAVENEQSGRAEDFDIKQVDKKKIYGGKEIAPPPETLTVTEEVWMDLKIKDYYGEGEDYVGRVTFACFGKLTPITCLNFISLAKGYRRGRNILNYKGSKVQAIVRDFMIQLGEVTTKSTSGDSIYGTSFQDESFAISHSNAGWIGMANFGPDTNGSQFYILLRSARWLDGKHVLFGKVIRGMDVVEKIGQEETGKDNTPLRTITIDNSGVVGLKASYQLTAAQFNTDGDIDTESVRQ